MTGSDLVPALFCGGLGAISASTAERGPKLASRFGCTCWERRRAWRNEPPFGSKPNGPASGGRLRQPGARIRTAPGGQRRDFHRIAESGCQVLVVGLGAPKQELWVHTHRQRIAAPVALVRRRDDRLSSRRKAAGARLDAPRRAGMDPSPGE